MKTGPTATIELTCSGCVHCVSRGYTCQGDSGSEVFCTAMDGKRVGDTCWQTPDWCPYRARAMKEVAQMATAEGGL